MKKCAGLLTIVIACISLWGCTGKSHVGMGPLYVQSKASIHEWEDADFQVGEGRIGSTLGFLSSEASVEWRGSLSLSMGASLSWDEGEGEASGDGV